MYRHAYRHAFEHVLIDSALLCLWLRGWLVVANHVAHMSTCLSTCLSCLNTCLNTCLNICLYTCPDAGLTRAVRIVHDRTRRVLCLRWLVRCSSGTSRQARTRSGWRSRSRSTGRLVRANRRRCLLPRMYRGGASRRRTRSTRSAGMTRLCPSVLHTHTADSFRALLL